MKVIITNASLGVPVGTIMDVGEQVPVAWRGKCVPYVEAQTEPASEIANVADGIKAGLEDAITFAKGDKSRAIVRKIKRG